MRRLAAGVAGALGLAALFHRLRRRRGRDAVPEVSPADELRARLAEAEARTSAPEPEPDPAAVAEPDPAAEPDGVDLRRRDVHDRARAALDELS